MTPEEMEQREIERSQCEHEWPAEPGWGVFIGITRCKKCGTLARTEDFAREERS